MITDGRASKMFRLLHEGNSVASIARRLKMSEKTVRTYRDSDRLPSQTSRPERAYRTRQDPLAVFWNQIELLLEQDPRLKPYAILDWLKQKHNPADGDPCVTDSIRRTLERRIQSWKLKHGVSQDVKFPQTHHAADVIAFDFVVMNSLKVTVGGKTKDHMMFHAVFTYSNWEYVHLCHSESFEALSTGLQDALHRAGGVPQRVRSDSLSAAVNNLSSDKEFATQYRDLLEHYGVRGHRINVRKPHENGDVESSHGHFKDALDQALRLRGSREFATVNDYLSFVRQIVNRRNASRDKRFREECAAFGPLPAQRRGTSTSVFVTVSSDCVIRVKRNSYSVDSKYIGLRVEIRIHQDHLELWYRNECLERMPRQYGSDKEAIDFRHVIDSLVRKPGAFINYKYVNHMYPTTRFRMAYDRFRKTMADDLAIKQYLKLLYAAKHEGLDIVDDTLRVCLSTDEVFQAADALARVARKQQLPAPTDVSVESPDLSEFDSLFQHKEVFDDPETNDFHPQEFDEYENENADGGLAAYDRHVKASGSIEGTAAADLPRESYVGGGSGGTRPMDAHPVSGGLGREGMPSQGAESYSTFDAQCAAVDGQDLGAVRLVTIAAACDPTVRDPSQRGLSGSTGQLVDFRQAGFRKNNAPVGSGGSTGEARPIDLLLHVPDAGTGLVACQARSATGTCDQDAAEIRRPDYRRPGIRPTEPRGDGGVIHASLGTLRTGQLACQLEPPVFQMGADLQGPDDNRCGDRQTDPSFGDHRTEHPQLPTRGRQETTAPTNTIQGASQAIEMNYCHGHSNCR
jgi:hypothetical protein